MDNQKALQAPTAFDVSLLPKNFGTGRLKDLLVTFDNFDIQSHVRTPAKHYPIKCDSVFSIVILAGRIDIRVNLTDMSIHEGELLVMMPGCIFETQEVSEDIRFCGIIIENNFWNAMRKNIGINLDLTQRYHTFMSRTVTPALMTKHIEMYKMICMELNSEDYLYKKEVIQRFCELWMLKIISLNNDKVQNKPELNKPQGRKEEIFHDFLSVLEKYYKQERSISFYADQMCLTPKYLSTIIKEVSGKHGMQWIDEYVALEAKALLRNSTLSVKQVADQLNFPSQSMFGRFFKKMTGCSPKQYKLM